MEYNRIFVAYEIKEETKSEIYKTQNKELKFLKHKLKRVPPENYHITIEFLGPVSEKEINTVKEIIINHKIKNNEINLTSLKLLPEFNPRVIYLHIDFNEQTLNLTKNMKQEINSRILHDKLHIHSYKTFLPHMTIARTKQKLTTQEIEKLKSIKTSRIRTELTSITIFNSILTPEGPKYEKIYSQKI